MRRVKIPAIASYGLCLVVGLALGTWFGSWQERVRREWFEFSDAVGRSFFLSERAGLQYCQADYDAAREAILAWLAHLEEARPIDGEYRDPLMTERGLAIDKTLALGRLARLEERQGQQDLASDYWRRAEAQAQAASWSDATELGIRAVIERIGNCDRPTTNQ